MQDIVTFIGFCIIVGLVWVFFLRKALKEEQRRFAKQEHLYDLLIDKLEYDLCEIEIDKEK